MIRASLFSLYWVKLSIPCELPPSACGQQVRYQPPPHFCSLPPNAKARKSLSYWSHYTTLGFAPAKEKQAQFSFFSGLAPSEAHRRITQKLEKRRNAGPVHSACQRRAPLSHKPSSALSNPIKISQVRQCPSISLGRLFEKPRFPLRGR